MSRSQKKTILKIRQLPQMEKMRPKLIKRGSRKVHDTGLKKTRRLSVIIVSSLDIWRESVLMTPRGSIAFSAVQIHMTPSIAPKRCVSNATKLVIKLKIVRKRMLLNVVSATMLVIERTDVLKHGQLRVQV